MDDTTQQPRQRPLLLVGLVVRARAGVLFKPGQKIINICAD
jgi:hypothetical protein